MELDIHHAMWEIFLFTNVVGAEDCKSALLLRYHHSLLDGINIMRILLQSTNYNGSDIRPRPPKSFRMNPFVFAGSCIKWTFKTIFSPHDKGNPLVSAPSLDATTPRHIMFRTMDASVEDVKKLKAKGFSVNDVLISCLAGAFGRFATKEYSELVTKTVHGFLWGTMTPVTDAFKPIAAGEKVIGNRSGCVWRA